MRDESLLVILRKNNFNDNYKCLRIKFLYSRFKHRKE